MLKRYIAGDHRVDAAGDREARSVEGTHEQ